MEENWKRGQKYRQLENWGHLQEAPWKQLKPDVRNTWLTAGQQADFADFIPLGNKSDKGTIATESMFRLFSLGIVSNRDSYAWNFSEEVVRYRMEKSVAAYRRSMLEYKEKFKRSTVAEVIDQNDPLIKWTRQTIASVRRFEHVAFTADATREASYRPYSKRYVYFQDLWNEEQYKQHLFYPGSETQNWAICWNSSPGSGGPFGLATAIVPDLHFVGDTQTFPFYTFEADGSGRKENITDWALTQYRTVSPEELQALTTRKLDAYALTLRGNF